MTFRKASKIVENNGWVLVRIVGSHHQYQHETIKGTITLVNHGSKDLSIGVIKSLERATGLSFRG